MVEETKVEEVKKEGEQQQEEVQLSTSEELAKKEGWHPKEDWAGDPEDWKDAKTFLRDGELFKKIEDIKRENKNLKRTVSSLKTHYEKVQETEYQRALATLKEQKKAALREGDTDLAVDLDDKIDQKREELDEARRVERLQQQDEPTVHPDFQEWVNRNKWYNTNEEVKDFADNVGVAYKKTHMQATPKQVLEYVEEMVAKGYPELFKNPRKNTPSAVEGGGAPRKPNSKVELTEFETQIMKKLVRSGALTEEQYRKDIETLDKQGKR